MVKILFLTEFYFPIYGGPSTDVFNLFKEFTKKKHDVTIVTPYRSNLNLSQSVNYIKVNKTNKIEMFKNKMKYLLFNPNFLGLSKSISYNDFSECLNNIENYERYDFIFSRGLWPNIINQSIYKNAISAMIFGTMPEKRKNQIIKTFNTVKSQEIDYRISTGYNISSYHWDFEGIPINKIIFNGVDTNLFCPNSFIDEKKITIGTVINFAYPKKIVGLITLIKAFCKLSAKNKIIYLKIVGEGHLKYIIESFIRNLNPEIQKRIILLDGIEYYKMPDFYNSLDIYAHFSYLDAGPNAILEAMSCEIPIVTNEIGDVSCYLGKDNKLGLIVPPNEIEIIKAFKNIIELDEKSLFKMRKMERERILNYFTWEKSALNYLNLYKRVNII